MVEERIVGRLEPGNITRPIDASPDRELPTDAICSNETVGV
jgi:hypothetical protein